MKKNVLPISELLKKNPLRDIQGGIESLARVVLRYCPVFPEKGRCWHRFHHSQAWITDPMGIQKIQLIQSYDTIVGVVVPDDETIYELGKYSVTTSKQLTQISRQWPQYRRVELERPKNPILCMR